MKDKQINIRLTEQQDNLIKEKATKKGLSKSEYIRYIIIEDIEKTTNKGGINMNELVDKVIYNKGLEVQERSSEELKKCEEYQTYQNQKSELTEQLRRELTPDQFKLFLKYNDAVDYSEYMEADHLFREGVWAGLIDLRYLKDHI